MRFWKFAANYRLSSLLLEFSWLLPTLESQFSFFLAVQCETEDVTHPHTNYAGVNKWGPSNALATDSSPQSAKILRVQASQTRFNSSSQGSLSFLPSTVFLHGRLLFFLPSPFTLCRALPVKIGSEDITAGRGCRTYCEHVHKIYQCFGMGFQIPMCMSQVSLEI